MVAYNCPNDYYNLYTIAAVTCISQIANDDDFHDFIHDFIFANPYTCLSSEVEPHVVFSYIL